MTTFLSITPSGGRFGRIAWGNGNDDTWGHVRWDHWWPRNPPALSDVAKAAAIIGQAMRAFGSSARLAAESVRAFGAAMAEADA